MWRVFPCFLSVGGTYLKFAMKLCAWKSLSDPDSIGLWQRPASVEIVATLLRSGVPAEPVKSSIACATHRTLNLKGNANNSRAYNN